MPNETSPKPSIWQQVLKVVKNPISALSDKTKDSPLITIIAIVFVLQPVLSTGVDLIKGMIEVKEQLNPNNRPVTKGELDIVNSKIDFIQQLIVTDMQKDAAAEEDRRKYRHQHDNQVANTTPPPVNTMPVAPVATVPVKPDDIRSRFKELNKKLEVIQAPLDKKFVENAKK